MRVGIDCRIASYTSGGTAVYVRRLVEAMVRLPEACKDQLWLLQAAQQRRQLSATDGQHVRLSRLFTPSHHGREQLLLPLELLRFRFDVLHSPDFIPPFRRRCSSVITVHDLAFLRYPEFLTAASRRYFNGQIGQAVASADRIIAVSNSTKRDLIELLAAPDRKIDVVYEAPDPDLSPAKDRQAVERFLREHGVASDYILHVGTLEPRKNLPVLLSALQLLKQRGYTGKLVLAGSKGWLYDDVFREIDRLALGKEVALLGQVSRSELCLLYNGARLLAFPSVYEGFGLPLVEAMACGLPAVISNVSSLPEIAGGAALAVDPGSAEEMAGAMERVLNDEALAASLSKKGLARAAEFSWERAARDTLAVYHRAA